MRWMLRNWRWRRKKWGYHHQDCLQEFIRDVESDLELREGGVSGWMPLPEAPKGGV